MQSKTLRLVRLAPAGSRAHGRDNLAEADEGQKIVLTGGLFGATGDGHVERIRETI